MKELATVITASYKMVCHNIQTYSHCFQQLWSW